MAEDLPFDRRLRRLRRDRAFRADPESRKSLALVLADELIDRLGAVRRDFADALIVGAAGPAIGSRLRARGMKVSVADAGFAFARAGGGVQCDEDRLPFADASHDLVIAAGSLDSVNDLPGGLVLMRRILRPGGLLLGAFAGAGSLVALRTAFAAADADRNFAVPRIHPQIDVRAAGDLLARAGFVAAVADSQSLHPRYARLNDEIRDLRAMGGTNSLVHRARLMVDRVTLAAARKAFRDHAEADGRTSERIEIVHFVGWAPK